MIDSIGQEVFVGDLILRVVMQGQSVGITLSRIIKLDADDIHYFSLCYYNSKEGFKMKNPSTFIKIQVTSQIQDQVNNLDNQLQLWLAKHPRFI